MSARTTRGNGRHQIAAFGASGKDADKSNATYLWSTVYLAIPKSVKAAGQCEE